MKSAFGGAVFYPAIKAFSSTPVFRTTRRISSVFVVCLVSTIVAIRRLWFDNGLARQEVLERTQMLLDQDDNIGAILLECSDMPPYVADIQRMTQLPVYDFITLINWLHQSVCQRPYDGWI